ncbi:MAG: 5-methyltetrahydropteroyltriglutamate--homocysteine S-methyltransferase [Cyanobacteria bacterium SW_9_44_58]|nr:MAG: 5-methyltetrahydropteroyltriglutamate--homocysteine S-methyltransferase [Cyanobacteria bacterium SW_9_44_58]
MTITTKTLGYPRIGKQREVKKALEAFWKGESDKESLLHTCRTVETDNWKTQLEAGIDRIGVGDATLYDHVLDWAVRLGIIPQRFRNLSGLDRYFAMARGKNEIPALEMTKWFDTNYHYLVPEVDGTLQPHDFSGFLETVQQAQTVLGENRAVPVVLGPVTLLRLSRLETDWETAMPQLRDRYVELLQELKKLGVAEVQLHEPALAFGDASNFRNTYELTYQTLAAVDVPINLATYFDDLGEAYPWVIQLPVSVISLDFTRGKNFELLEHHGFPEDKQLGVGIVDARNVWKVHPEATLSRLESIESITSNLSIQPSASLQFVPYDAQQETKLPEELRNVLSFAEQKLEEVGMLANALSLSAEGAEDQLALWHMQWEMFEEFNDTASTVQEQLNNLTDKDFQRPLPYQKRRDKQPDLPLFPTTTIGSFPQTSEVRKLRGQLRRGEITEAEYQSAIDQEIAKCIHLQEEAGLDVLVHGEFERTDMVEFFAQQLSGFAFTSQGWVQSYGNRYVRPPIIYGDVARPQPMTVQEFQYAQSLTSKFVKGMLTGPVTMLNWSFPRNDISCRNQAMQIALALREEVNDLQQAGAKMIQMDEPALREGLPLKPERWEEYLSWAVDAFRLATSVAKPETQIHTHMCYSEFGDIIDHIERLDADVLSIENSRSNNETLFEVTNAGYQHEVGNGIYDVHSPSVPSVEQMVQQLRTGVENLPVEQIWVNPDCGLKTRSWEEVMPSLKNMVKAAQTLRQEVESQAT